MTNRYRKVTIVLDRDYRDDDAEAILKALGMVKGVAAVHPHVVDCADWLARETAKLEYWMACGKALRDVFENPPPPKG